MDRVINKNDTKVDLGEKNASEDVSIETSGKVKEIIENVDTDKWGYAVCFGTVITFIAGIGHINSFGLIYKDFIDDTHSSAKSLTSAHGIFAVMLAVGGIILNVTFKKFSLRVGGLVGAFIMLTGSFWTIFITNTSQLPLTFGVLQGIGFGMVVPVCFSTINFYYVRKRTMVMSICKALQGIILMWYPQLLKKILILYGFRGTLLIISGVALHIIPGMLVMKTKDNKPRKLRTANKVTSTKRDEENIDLLDHKPNDQIEDINRVWSRRKIILKFCSKVLELMNFKIFKDLIYCNICLGQSFVNFSDLTFFIFQPMLLYEYGYNTTQVAACISICAGADVAGRCLLAFISGLVNVNTRGLFYTATFFTFLFRIAILQLHEFHYVAIVTACLGVLRAWLHVASPLVISNHVSHADFPGAYALFMLSAGLVNVTFAPLIGLLKDIYQDYVPAFYALTICCLPCLIFWPIEYFKRRK